MQTYDVFFYEAFEEEAAALQACLPADIKAGYSWKTTQEYGQPLPVAPCISIRTQSELPAAWAGHLQAILSRSTGYDHLLRYRAMVASPPACAYLPLYCHRAVAEQALMMWMALLRKLPRQLRQLRNFERDGLTGREARDRTLLVVGVGNIGHEVVRIGQGLGMRALGVDIGRKHPDVDYIDIEQAIGQADVIVCAMNLTEDNRGYFDKARLQAVKPGTIFINISRGELSPPATLLELLGTGQLGGVGLDVYHEESTLAVALRENRPAGSPDVRAVLEMAQLENVVLTPHNAFNTLEAVARKAEQSVQQIVAWLETGAFLWPLP